MPPIPRIPRIPRVVYRGGTTPIDQLSKRGEVAWFSDNKKIARTYEESKKYLSDRRPVTLPAKVRMENPLIVEATGYSWESVPVPASLQKVWQNQNGTTPPRFLSSDEIAELARDGGYSGVIFHNLHDAYNTTLTTPASTIIATWTPSAISSARKAGWREAATISSLLALSGDDPTILTEGFPT